MRSFETVYETHRAAVYHTALSFLKDPAAAEDVMQEVFLSYYHTLREGQSIRHLRAWLLTATRRRCLNLLRDSHPEELSVDLADLPLADPAADPTEQLALRQALCTLTAQERLVFALHHLDGYKYREIAAGLSLPMGTVQTRCHTARRKLRAALLVEPEHEKEEAAL